MATFTNLIVKPLQNLCPTTKPIIFSSHHTPHLLSLLPTRSKTLLATSICNTPPLFVTKATSGAATSKTGTTGGAASVADHKVKHVHTVEEFEVALREAKDKLVVVEYAASHSKESSKIYPFMVELSRTCSDVVFLLVMGDESEETKELCRREKIEKVPHFSFYKSMEKIHDEEGIGPDMLMGDVLYYGDSHSSVVRSPS